MLLSAITGMARTLPLAAGYRIADWLSEGHRLLSPGRRSAVRENLRVLVEDEVEVTARMNDVFRNYGRFLFEFLRGPDVGELPHSFEGWEALERARSRGRGVILAVLHTGNWEITGARLSASGVPVHAVAGVQLNGAWTRELRRRQERAGIRILPPGAASWRDIPRVLARNEALALLVDGDVYRKGVTVPLCGRSVHMPAGPARLAARTGAALLPMYCRRDPGGALAARFLEEVPVRDGSRAAVRDATARMTAQFEKVLRKLPGQWLIFREFFGEPVNGGTGSVQ